MALALLIIGLNLLAAGAQTYVALPSVADSSKFGCNYYNNLQFWGGPAGLAAPLISTTHADDVDACVQKCQFENSGCVEAVFDSSPSALPASNCAMHPARFDGQSVSTGVTSVLCPGFLVPATKLTIFSVTAADSTPSTYSAIITSLTDNDPSTSWNTVVVSGAPTSFPAATFGGDLPDPPAPAPVGSSDSKEFILVQINAPDPLAANVVPMGWQLDRTPGFSGVRFRTVPVASPSSGLDGFEVTWGRGSATLTGAPAPSFHSTYGNDSSTLGSGALIVVQFNKPIPFTDSNANTFGGLRVLSFRTPSATDQDVTGDPADGVLIADMFFYADAPVLIPIPSSSSSSPYSSTAESSSSSSSTAALVVTPPPTAAVCTSDCQALLRQNCTASGPCGACIPGKFGSPPPSNIADCCTDDCPSLHRHPCSNSGDYCGECLDGWIPPLGAQATQQLMHTQACLPSVDVNGGWSPWFSCDRACGGGKRFRTCSDPLPAGNGANCIGLDVSDCNIQPCPSTQSSDPCMRSPPECLNGATCVSWVDVTNPCGYGHTCQCMVGYFGRRCETDAVGKAVGNILKSIQDASAFQRYYFPDARTAASLQWPKPRPGEEWGDNLDRRISRLEDEGFAGYGSPEELRHWALFHQPGHFGPYPITPSSTGGLPPLSEVINRLLYPTSGLAPKYPPLSSSSVTGSSSSASTGSSSSSSTGSSTASSTGSSTGSTGSSSTSDTGSSTGSSSTSDTGSSTGSSSTSDTGSSTGSSSSSSASMFLFMELSETVVAKSGAEKTITTTTPTALITMDTSPTPTPTPPAVATPTPTPTPPAAATPTPAFISKRIEDKQPTTSSPAALQPEEHPHKDSKESKVSKDSDAGLDQDWLMQQRANDALEEASEEAAAAVQPSSDFFQFLQLASSVHKDTTSKVRHEDRRYSHLQDAEINASSASSPRMITFCYSLALLLLLCISLLMQPV